MLWASSIPNSASLPRSCPSSPPLFHALTTGISWCLFLACSANKVPALQRFFQANPNLLIFEKTAQDQTVYKFMMTSGTLAFFGAVFGIGQLATASVRVPVSVP